MVILSEDATRVAVVTYWQHAGWYTRIGGRDGFGIVDGTHPIVYAGLKNHGSYHNTENIAQSCCFGAMSRNDLPAGGDAQRAVASRFSRDNQG